MFYYKYYFKEKTIYKCLPTLGLKMIIIIDILHDLVIKLEYCNINTNGIIFFFGFGFELILI